MNIYKGPYEFSHEEKIFGGYLSLRQMLYLILGVASSGLFFIPHIPIALKVTIFFVVVITFLMFAFLKIGQVYADKIFLDIIKYIFRKKIYLSER